MIINYESNGYFEDVSTLNNVQILDVVYIRKNVKEVNFEKDNPRYLVNCNIPRYEYDEVVLTLEEYENLKHIEDIFSYVETELQKEPTIEFMDYDENISRMENKSVERIIEGHSWQNNYAPSSVAQTAIRGIGNQTVYLCGKNIFSFISPDSDSITLTSSSLPFVKIGYLHGVLQGKKVTTNLDIELSDNNKENPSFQIVVLINGEYYNLVDTKYLSNNIQTYHFESEFLCHIDTFDYYGFSGGSKTNSAEVFAIIENIDGTLKLSNIESEVFYDGYTSKRTYERFKYTEENFVLPSSISSLYGDGKYYDSMDETGKVTNIWKIFSIFNDNILIKRELNLEDPNGKFYVISSVVRELTSIRNPGIDNFYCGQFIVAYGINDDIGGYADRECVWGDVKDAGKFYMSIPKEVVGTFEDLQFLYESTMAKFLNINIFCSLKQGSIKQGTVTGNIVPYDKQVNNIWASKPTNRLIDNNTHAIVVLQYQQYSPINIYRIYFLHYTARIDTIGTREE